MRSISLHSAFRTAIVVLSLALCGCATTQQPADEEEDQYQVNDPLEPVNRGIFTFNIAVDDYVLRPVAQAYRDYVPMPVRDSVHAFLTNLRSPVILFNDGLQGQGKLAGDTFARFWLNTVLGFGGLVDVGTRLGIPFHDADFGQTFGVWGVPAGPYLVLPILGPSDPRDTVGFAADTFGDPFNGVMNESSAGTVVIYSRGAADGVDLRSRNIDTLDRIRSTSLDYYATIRSLYRQRRESLIRHEAPPEGNPALSLLPEQDPAETIQ